MIDEESERGDKKGERKSKGERTSIESAVLRRAGVSRNDGEAGRDMAPGKDSPPSCCVGRAGAALIERELAPDEVCVSRFLFSDSRFRRREEREELDVDGEEDIDGPGEGAEERRA